MRILCRLPYPVREVLTADVASKRLGVPKHLTQPPADDAHLLALRPEATQEQCAILRDMVGLDALGEFVRIGQECVAVLRTQGAS